ncbi:Multimeric flavodoxin WrbA [Candidatus Omnitrophus magneticus]|uniref:Multimeric flavodoxin WrbA n=1 Tax=Candidatus Omnitrophus magneticus TaxID=1609969 RepID=A0A0F0CLB9_9BACT|nr:Multimeric flavodoxin WrbA [Candidatus Omnitrophus magneticus]
MKILAILAGPRKNQVTDNLTNNVLKGFKEQGIESEKIYLYDSNIKPCTGCMSCYETQKCVIKDDMELILNKMRESEIIVFASPVYFSNVTSDAKKFFDRGVSFFKMTQIGPKQITPKPKSVILITSCGAPFPFSHILGTIGGSLRAMKAFFGCMSVKIQTITATGIMNFDKKTCAKFMGKAYNLGKNFKA